MEGWRVMRDNHSWHSHMIHIIYREAIHENANKMVYNEAFSNFSIILSWIWSLLTRGFLVFSVFVEEPVRPTISSGYYERSVPSFLAQGRGKGASSTLMSQARLYVESPFLSASHAGHRKPPKMKTSSIFVILQLLHENTSKTTI